MIFLEVFSSVVYFLKLIFHLILIVISLKLYRGLLINIHIRYYFVWVTQKSWTQLLPYIRENRWCTLSMRSLSCLNKIWLKIFEILIFDSSDGFVDAVFSRNKKRNISGDNPSFSKKVRIGCQLNLRILILTSFAIHVFS